jgi:hypothetical protein
MKSPNWLKGYVETLDISYCGKYRSDCPVCHRKNTFSVTDDGLQRLWFCFHADCNVSGKTGINLSRKHTGSPFRKHLEKLSTDKTFEVPLTFVSLSRSLDAELYVRSVGAYDSYMSGEVDIRYDFRENRVVFLVKNDSQIVDACGRSLNQRKPKWRRYGSSKYPFVAGDRSIVFVVEDCSSASSVGSLCTGLALMGTNLLDTHIDVIKKYKKVFVALDKDATDKAIKIVRKLKQYVPTKLVVLHKDIKNMERQERDEFIQYHVNR